MLNQISTFVHQDDVTGKFYAFGRARPTTLPKAYFHEFLTSTPLPTPPATCDWSTRAPNALSNIYLNDQLGCCVISGCAHMIGVWTGDSVIFTSQQIKNEYGLCGYPPDQGCSEQDLLTKWTQGNFASVANTQLLGFTGVDASDVSICKSCINLFGGLVLGIELPNAYTNPMPSASGFTWDVAGRPNPRQGHCIVAVGYNAIGVLVATWGMLGTLTWAALAKYCVAAAGGELYAAMSSEWYNNSKSTAPNAIDDYTLTQYFNSIGGSVPLPSQPPPSGPTPPPAPLNTSNLISIDYTNKQVIGLPDPSSWSFA